MVMTLRHDDVEHLKAMCVALRISGRVDMNVDLVENRVLRCTVHLPKGTMLSMNKVGRYLCRRGFVEKSKIRVENGGVWVCKRDGKDQDKFACTVRFEEAGIIEIVGFHGREELLDVFSVVVDVIEYKREDDVLDGMRDC